MAGYSSRAVARIDLVDVEKTLTEQAGGARSTFSIRHLTLRVHDGETLVVLGPSGCGKTTLLRLIAGLIEPDSGDVRFDDVNVKDVAPGARRIGMVFQNYALYPHLTSRTNVLAYFLFRRKTPELDALARAKYQRTADLMGVELTDLLDRKPPTLSGGEKQRVALGRCITRDASIFLVDEPFANLDQALREKYRVNLKTLLRQFNITTVYVTHDHQEALILAHRLAVMNAGRIEQVGTPEEIYDTPVNLFVAGFLNLHPLTPPINVIDGRAMPARLGLGETLAETVIGVRPEDVQISGEAGVDRVAGVVTETLSLPLTKGELVTVRVGDHDVQAPVPGEGVRRIGDRVWLAFRRFHVFEKGSGQRRDTLAL